MKNKLLKLKQFILNIIFPPLCIVCKDYLPQKSKNFVLCPECKEKIEAKPEKSIIKLENKSYTLITTSKYSNNEIRNILHALKYNKIKGAIGPIKEFFIKPTIQKYQNIFKENKWSLIPIPLHYTKEKQRGFNQSKLITQAIQTELENNNIQSNILNNFLIKTRKTKSQTDLSKEKRKENLKNAFDIKKYVENKNIILVDDVYTTGSTINSCLEILQKTNPNKIIVFTIAKT